MERLPNLDPLRFFLATLVILFHIPQLSFNQGLPTLELIPLFKKGTEAVYMFFVLSGFLIIRLIYRHKLQDRFSIGKFYMRRVLRIFPLYYLVAAFGFVFYHVLLPLLNIPYEINYHLSEGLLLTVFFLPNIFVRLYEVGGILKVLWSLGIEEQFYILIAPFMFFISKTKILKVLLVVVTLYFITFHLHSFPFLKRYYMVYFFLLFGGVIAILEEKNYLEFLKCSKLVPFSITLITLLYFSTDIFLFKTFWLNNLFTMLCFGLFIHSIAFNNFKVEIRSKWLHHLGQISYGLYMYHVIALNLVVFVFLKIQALKIFSDLVMILLIYILTFVLTIVMAHFSYTYFETYFLRLKNKFR